MAERRSGQAERLNRLKDATSPYLLDHAHNPVDWWPWGLPAFEEARRRGVPILLSIGYSTCYWCHVMARESFENDEIAKVLNERFVCIKVDREERPDVDDLYMTSTLVSAGHGGWPLTAFLEPDGLKPLYCGTYFPPRAGGHSVPSLPDLAHGISHSWANDRERVMKSAEAIADAVAQEFASTPEPAALTGPLIEQAAQALLTSLDRTHGGFGGAPKFPQPVNLAYLMDLRERVRNQDARTAVDAAIRGSLDAMACGGIFDHVGGGFHRYAVDATWTVPHFEKMLYDNAQLLGLYARAAAAYDHDDYRWVARRVIDYLDREMTAEDGAFFSAQDAEVDGREGANYVWTPDQVRAVLNDSAEPVVSVYGLDHSPNFRDPHHPNEPAVHVLRLDATPTQLADRLSIDRDAFLSKLDDANRRLLRARDKRAQPRLDDKVLASWNGLMIEGLAEAAIALKDPDLLNRAVRAADALLARLTDDAGILLRASRGGSSHTPAFLEDYGMVISGLAATVRAGRSLDQPCEPLLDRAIALGQQAVDRLGDAEGGFLDSGAGSQELFVAPRTAYDGTMPTGQSAMLMAMLDLARLAGTGAWSHRAIAMLRGMSGRLAARPVASLHALRALLLVFDDPDLRAHAEAFGPPVQPSTPEPSEPDDFTPVEVYADRESITVGRDSPAELWLELRIAPGFHVVAADPGSSDMAGSLLPIRVFLLEGSGVAVYADYPSGDQWGPDGVLVHRDTVRLRVAVERTEEHPERVLLGVRFQACDEQSCRLPTTVELDVSVEIV